MTRLSLILAALVLFPAPRFQGDALTPAPPLGSMKAVRDTCANLWTLGPARGGTRRLLVLPAQDRTGWVEPQPAISGADPGPWSAIEADEIGFVWLTKTGRSYRFDPRKPDQGVVQMERIPTSVATQTLWQTVARMPASNHDLTAAVLGKRLYVAGGLTAEWGYPTRSHPFDELWELDTSSWKWRAVARFGRNRVYCATAEFGKKIWIVGGDTILADGKRQAQTAVQIFDPATGRLSEGVPGTIARPMPLALSAAGRLYVIGNERGHEDQPGRMESIGPGETAWRPEPDGPRGMGPLAGATLDDRLYLAVRDQGLAIYDTNTRSWQVDSTFKPRSCQMAAWRGEIWMLGGRDTAGEDLTLIYSPRSRSWRNGPKLPRPLSWGAAGVVGDRLILTGGAASYGRDYLYNDLTFLLK